jgi:hypothetical protein
MLGMQVLYDSKRKHARVQLSRRLVSQIVVRGSRGILASISVTVKFKTPAHLASFVAYPVLYSNLYP